MGAEESKSIENTTEVIDDDTTLSRPLESDQTPYNVVVTLQPNHPTNIDFFSKRLYAADNPYRSFHSSYFAISLAGLGCGGIFCHPCRMATTFGLLHPTAHWSDSPLVRQPIGPTARWSDRPLVRQPGDSDSPLVRQPVDPTVRWSDSPLVHRQWSDSQLVRQPVGPTVRKTIGPTIRRSDTQGRVGCGQVN